MTHRLSDAKERHRLLPPADPVRTDCAPPPSARNTIALMPNLSEFRGSSNAFVPVSAIMRIINRTADIAVAPTVFALSP